MNSFQSFLVKSGKNHYYTYRPKEYYKKCEKYNLKVVLCSITNKGLLHFSFGADIIDKKIHEINNILGDRAVLQDSITFKKFGLNKSIYYAYGCA